MRVRKIITSIFIPLALACAEARVPVAVSNPPAAAPPPPELSTIVIPIRASLAPLLPELEAHVPVTFADTQKERGIDVRYEVAREPLQLKMIGAGLHSTTTVKYALEACRGRFPCISCGFGEARRTADITLHTKLEWDASWKLRSTTRPLPVHYGKKCEVTWFDIDITRRFVAPVVEDQLAIAARTIDRNVPQLAAVRTHAENIWTSLQTPVEIAPRTWLTLEPSEVSLTPITGSGLDVTSTLSLRALTRVVVGAKPAVAPKPLPPLRVAAAMPAGMRVPFDIELPYEDASQLAARELAGKTFTVDGKPLRIESLTLRPAPGGKVLVEAAIDYGRTYRGNVFLEGTPRFDTATSSLVFPDLEYSLDPKRRGLLVRIAERTAHDSIRDRLRQSARFPLAPRIDELRGDITAALTRRLAPGVFLRGRAEGVQPVSVTPAATMLVVRVIATGRAEVELR